LRRLLIGLSVGLGNKGYKQLQWEVASAPAWFLFPVGLATVEDMTVEPVAGDGP
jgi:hypothetical protein